LLTPFNGAIPPSNLLDKIARGVAHAKGPAEWHHSLRATRAKIVELARIRAKESVQVDIIEESGDDDPRDILRPTGRTNRKRPLYRQNSMDFLLDVDLSIRDNQTINRYVHQSVYICSRVTSVSQSFTTFTTDRPLSPQLSLSSNFTGEDTRNGAVFACAAFYS
jgi:hypothetical protein